MNAQILQMPRMGGLAGRTPKDLACEEMNSLFEASGLSLEEFADELNRVLGIGFQTAGMVENMLKGICFPACYVITAMRIIVEAQRRRSMP